MSIDHRTEPGVYVGEDESDAILRVVVDDGAVLSIDADEDGHLMLYIERTGVPDLRVPTSSATIHLPPATAEVVAQVLGLLCAEARGRVLKADDRESVHLQALHVAHHCGLSIADAHDLIRWHGAECVRRNCQLARRIYPDAHRDTIVGIIERDLAGRILAEHAGGPTS